MTITDIENAVTTLSLRHDNLTETLLRTLLEASGWEEKYIKEAEIIFKAHKASGALLSTTELQQNQIPTGLATVTQEDGITFVRSDGTEEGDLVEPVSISDKKEISNSDHISTSSIINNALNYNEEDGVYADPYHKDASGTPSGDRITQEVSTTPANELVSLVKPVDMASSGVKKEVDLPDNLPLVPFESSPHVWSFAQYKSTFYDNEISAKEEEIRIPKDTPQHRDELSQDTTIIKQEKGNVSQVVATPVITHSESMFNQVEKEDSGHVYRTTFEEVPITKGDESLIVLAGVTLLAILLLLGYMYGQGRL